MRWRNRNIETEKSEQCLLKFLYLDIMIFTVCIEKHFKNCYTKLDRAELLSSSIRVNLIHISEICDLLLGKRFNETTRDSTI